MNNKDRIARLRAELDALPFVDREAKLAAMPKTDRDALVAEGLEEIEGVRTQDYEDANAEHPGRVDPPGEGL